MLSDEHKRLVRAIVQGVVPGAVFRVFGSRATGQARPFSDLDLLILQPWRLTWAQRAALRDAFEASELPYCVDVVEAGALPAGMAERIQQEMLAI
jgi:type I restriction enzyme S subunit